MIKKYEHHGVQMSVQDNLKGLHVKHCLCYQGCLFFRPNTPENCPVAQKLFEFDVANNVVTPVWECKEYEENKNELDP